MTMHICPSCGKNNTVVSDDGKKGFCISCGQPFTIEEQNEKAWNEGLDDREQYWCQELLKVAPVSLALSYQQLFEYIKEGNIGCTLFLIRDVYELLMKIPVIVLFNGVYSVIENKKDITKFLEQHPRFTKVYRSSAQVFTSGKWMEAVRNGAALTKETRSDVFDKDEDQLYIETVNYLASIENEFNFLDPKKGCSNKGEPSKVSNMSEWRNRALGHGCLARDPEESYQEIPYILKMFKSIGELSLEYYNNVSFKCGHVRLRGVDTFPNIKGKISVVCGGLGKEKEYNIHEFVTAQEKNLAYYDGYNRGKAFLLDYGDGNRYKDKALTEFLQKHLDALKNNSAFTLSSESAEADNLEEADIRELEERLRHHDSIVYIDSLYKWIKNAMDSCDKGLLLLQMERGMGKTTFCDTIDQLSDSDIVREYSADIPGWTEFMANTVIRVWHFNSTFRGRPDIYIEGIKNALLTLKNEKKDNRLTGCLNETWDGLLHCEKEMRHVQFAEALNQTAEAQMRSSGRGKVLLVLDGVDELTDLQTLGEYLPGQNELEPNIYILITCRTDIELTSEQKNIIHEKGFVSWLLFTRSGIRENAVTKSGINIEYPEAVRKYLRDAFPVKLSEKEIGRIAQHFDYRFSDITAYKNLCQVNPVFRKLDSNDLVALFMKEVGSNTPEVYMKKMACILQCLAWAGSELTLREIAYLTGEGYVSYRLLGMMDELKAFVRVVRTERGNCYELSHESWKAEIIRIYPCGGIDFRNRCNNLLEEINLMPDEEKECLFLCKSGFEGEKWLIYNMIKIYGKFIEELIENWYEDIPIDLIEKILESYIGVLSLQNKQLIALEENNNSDKLTQVNLLNEIFNDYGALINAYNDIATRRNEGQLNASGTSYTKLSKKLIEVLTLVIYEAKDIKNVDSRLLATVCNNYARQLHRDNYVLFHFQIVDACEFSINLLINFVANEGNKARFEDLYDYYMLLLSTAYYFTKWMYEWGDVAICQQSLERVLSLMENIIMQEDSSVFYLAHLNLVYGKYFASRSSQMDYYNKTVKLTKGLLDKMPNEEVYISLACSAYTSIATYLESELLYEDAEIYWKEMINAYRNKVNLVQYSGILQKLGDNCMYQKRYNAAVKCYEEIMKDYCAPDDSLGLVYDDDFGGPEYCIERLNEAYTMMGSIPNKFRIKKDFYEKSAKELENANQEVYVILKTGFPKLLQEIPPAILKKIVAGSNPNHEFEYCIDIPFSAQQGKMSELTKQQLKYLQEHVFSVYGDNIFGDDEEKRRNKEEEKIQKDKMKFLSYILKQKVKKCSNWEYRLKMDETLSQAFFEELETVLNNCPRAIIRKIPAYILKGISIRNRKKVAFIFRNGVEYDFRKGVLSSKMRLNAEVLSCAKYLLDKYVSKEVMKLERQKLGKV